jgi:maltose/maltodextrin transport system substrate-binding protein
MRRLAGVAALAAASLALPAHANDPLKLLVWINGDKGYKTGVRVEVQHPESAPEKFQQAVGAGKGPDVFCWPHDRVGEWAKAGLLVPVRANKAIRDEIEESAWEAFRYRGKVWGYPIGIEANGLIYNKDLVPVPPSTFDEVRALEAELRKQGKKAVLWDFNKTFFTWPLLGGAGGFVFGKDPRGDFDPMQVGVNTPGAVKGGEMLKQLVDEKILPKGARYAEMEAGFARGTVAMMVSGPWAWDNAKRARINFGVAPIPAVVPGQPSQAFVGVLGCMISSPSKLKDVAREFLEHHLLRPEQLKVVNADVSLGVPANKAFYAELSSDPNIRATMENARTGRPVPNIPEVGRFWTAMDAALEAITNGLQSPQEALDGAAARMKVQR